MPNAYRMSHYSNVILRCKMSKQIFVNTEVTGYQIVSFRTSGKLFLIEEMYHFRLIQCNNLATSF